MRERNTACLSFPTLSSKGTELHGVGNDKRSLKVAKNRLCTHKRAKRKREDMANILTKMR
ncbi:60S ribosomal protein L36-1 [Platanthera guangdongensis]|uniref:60S ribosomal protein L36-1 n=1 Tax=Platanthera guangdongensis TaxID=2320717 RepID=A0ABR2LRY7_9ASPA